MAVYLVTYDLHNPGANYTEILEEIKKTGWAMLSESCYAISTDETADAAYRRIHVKADDNDTMYVIALKEPWTGRGPVEVNDWLAQNLI